VKGFIESKEKIPVSSLAFEEPRKCRFSLGRSQIDTIERALNTYGRDLAAMTKIVSYVHVATFHRECEFVN